MQCRIVLALLSPELLSLLASNLHLLQALSSVLTTISVVEAPIDDALASFHVPTDAVLVDHGCAKWKLLTALAEELPGAAFALNAYSSRACVCVKELPSAVFILSNFY